AGAASLLYAQAASSGAAFALAWPLLGAAMLTFLVPAAWAIARREARAATARGLGLALAALALVVLAGAGLAAVRGGVAGAIGAHTSYTDVRVAHLSIGVLAWVGGLVAAVSWQVLPMFFLAPAPSRAITTSSLACTAISLVLLAVASFAALPVPTWSLAIPAAISAWVLAPGWAITALRARKRKRKDPTLWFWWLGAALAPLCLALAALTLATDWPIAPLLLGLCVAWGWAGTIVHGMLLRIVPFLVWLHWCAPHVGSREVPSAKELLPDREARVGFVAHALALLLGAIGVTSQHELAWRAFGLGLVVVGLSLGRAMLFTIRRART
ncbi:MAG: hypothetical protein K1X94_27300, partial [Sandaracinaceae bacterium]|nr:hypothetical protein [Sandaracinaceae bacterium]